MSSSHFVHSLLRRVSSSRAVILGLLTVSLSAAVLLGCTQAGSSVAAGQPGELVVYSARNERFVDPLLEKFAADTGITVRALHAGSGVVSRLVEESRNVQVDIFISNDAGALEYLRMGGYLQGFESEGIDPIAPRYRAADNSWFALSARTRVLMYNKDLITADAMPQTIWELADPTWAGKFAITRGGNASMIAHVSALRYEWGDSRTAQWIAGVRENAGAIMQGHGNIRRAVGAGEFAFGLVNNYYYHQQLLEPTDNNVGVIYPDQGEDEMGAVVNAAGVAFVAGAPNAENARHFLTWILRPENQREFSYASMEVPINPSIEAVGEAVPISNYKVHSMALSNLGEIFEDTREFIERAGLALELR